MKTALKINAELTEELYLKTTGYTTTVEVEPGGTLNGLGYNASVYDVVVLDNDGRKVAYRYSDDGIDTDWAIGDVGDVADAVVATQEGYILETLTDEDVEAWHSGAGSETITSLIERFGVFEVWGSRQGPEPLTIRAGE